MVQKHDGWEERAYTFQEAWERLNACGAQQLTTRAATPFVANAATTTRGKRRGQRVIRYFQDGQEYGRCYDCWWGHYHNCNRARIGMYSAAVDEWIRSTGNPTKLTREGLLERIEQNGGPEGLNLEGRDLSELDLGRDAIRAELQARGISDHEDFPTWVYSIARYPEGINLRRVVLQQADLRGANLAWANLQQAKLWNANLQGADLRGASLQETELGAKFNSLEGAYLFRARLERTQLTNKQLGRAIGEHRDAVYDEAKEAYLVLRRNFESIGRYDDASWAYVKERQMERKTHQPNLARQYYRLRGFGLYPSPTLLPGPDLYPRDDSVTFGTGIGGRLRTIGYWAGFHVKHTAWWITDCMAESICGYGQNAWLVVGWMAALLLLFGPALTARLGGLYWDATSLQVYSGLDADWRRFLYKYWQSFLYTLDTFTTASYSQFVPRTDAVRLSSGLMAMTGILLSGLLGFVAGNRMSRS